MVNSTENDKHADLAVQAKIRHCDSGQAQKVFVTGQRRVLANHGRPAVGNAEVVIANVQKVPQPSLLDVLWTVSYGHGAELVQVEFGGDSYGKPRQLPAQVGQVEGADTQSSHIIKRVIAVKHGLADEFEEDRVADIKGRPVILSMQGGHGENCCGEKRR